MLVPDELKNRASDLGIWLEVYERAIALDKVGVQGKDLEASLVETFPVLAAPIAEEVEESGGVEPAAAVESAPVANTLASVRWVAAKIIEGKKLENEEYERLLTEAPSQEAAALLDWVLDAKANESDFWRQVWPKTLPTRAQLEGEARYADDGRETFRVIDRIRMQQAAD